MKKIFVAFAVLFVLVVGINIAYAADGPAAPKCEGADVVFPSIFIETAGKGEVRCSYHDLIGKDSDRPMQQRGSSWVASGGCGTDIHPYVLRDGKKNFCKIEETWSTGAEFVKWRKAGPCIFVK